MNTTKLLINIPSILAVIFLLIGLIVKFSLEHNQQNIFTAIGVILLLISTISRKINE